jgi:hypothetical protein
MSRNRQHAIYGLYLPDQPDVILYAGSWSVATLDERLRQHRDGECRTTAKIAARGGVKTDDLRMRVLAYWISGVDQNPEGEVVLGLQVQGWCRWNHPYALSTEDSRRGGRISGRKLADSGWHQTLEGREAHSRAARIGGRMGWRALTREERAAIGRASLAKRTPEQRTATARSAGRASMAKRTREDRWAIAAKSATWSRSPEGREARARAGSIGGRNLMASGWHQSPEGQEAHTRSGRISINGMSREEHAHGGYIVCCARYHADRPKIDRLCVECTRRSGLVENEKPG